MSDVERMHELLAALRRSDELGVVVSSDTLAADLGWSPSDVAATLRDAKADMLIWGLRAGGTPQPHFDEIELTVQGNRFLRNAPPAD
jgi:hypothetical protein